MQLKTSAIALGAVLAVIALQPASADPYVYGANRWQARDDIGRDFNEVRRDREVLRADEARLARERSEVEAARVREREELRRGNVVGVVRSYEQEQREVRELGAAQAKVDADRRKLGRDTQELHREIQHHRRWWWWG